MIYRLWVLVVPVLVCTFFFSHGLGTSARLDPADVRTLEWFSSLGLKSSQGLRPVEVSTGGSVTVGGEPKGGQTIVIPAFLVQSHGGNFRALSLSLRTRDFVTDPNSQRPHRVHYQATTLTHLMAPFLAPPPRYSPFRLESFQDEPIAAYPAGEFVLAWHCWSHGRPDLADRFLARLRQQREADAAKTGQAVVSLQTQIGPQIANFVFQHILASFGDRQSTRPEILLSLRHFQQNFPLSADAARARQLAAGLEALMLEEKERPLLSDEVLATLPPRDLAAELVRRLRVHDLPATSQPANPFGELWKLGDAAVPALIATLDDHRPSRGVYFSVSIEHPRAQLPSIGSLAENLFTYISGHRFKYPGGTSVYLPSPANSSARRLEAELWWAEYQRQGPRQYLIDATIAADERMPSHARRLIKEFPADASAPVLAGYARLQSDKKPLILDLLGDLDDPACVALLRREAEQGASIEIRKAAARSLEKHEQKAPPR